MAKRHLTDASVQRFKIPAQGQTEIFDLGYPGLALRIGNGGAKSFILFYRHNGRLTRRTIGRWPQVSLADAREAWRKTREAVARGDNPVSPGSRLFEHAVEDWLRRDVATRNKALSAYQVTRMVERDLLPAWRGRPVSSITKSDVIALFDGVHDRAPVKARRLYASTSRMFKWLTGRGTISVNPMLGVEKLGTDRARERVLSDEELASVWRATSGTDPYWQALRLLILTGARREEIGRLKWSEIQGDTVYLSGARTKNGEPHLIPLSDPARELLRNLPRIAGEYVFTITGDKPLGNWSRAKERLDAACGVNGWRVHDIRRTVATGMQKLGVGLQTVETLLGHTSGSRAGIVKIYQTHDYLKERREAVALWGAHVMSKVQT
jgi:integrase